MPAALPSSEEVTNYLAAHKLESVIEDAVNDAVLKQVKNPFRHIAEILLKKSEEVGEAKPSGARVSIGDVSQKKAAFAADAVVVAADVASSMHASNEEAMITREFQHKDAKLSEQLEKKLKSFFDKMDADGNGEVSKDEAIQFWGNNFAKVNATSMFNEVDEDGNGSVTWDEFLSFWQNVAGSGYDQDDLEEEVDMMLEGGSWVDFNDGRTT